jgi:hypothetical protein
LQCFVALSLEPLSFLIPARIKLIVETRSAVTVLLLHARGLPRGAQSAACEYPNPAKK